MSQSHPAYILSHQVLGLLLGLHALIKLVKSPSSFVGRRKFLIWSWLLLALSSAYAVLFLWNAFHGISLAARTPNGRDYFKVYNMDYMITILYSVLFDLSNAGCSALMVSALNRIRYRTLNLNSRVV